MSERGVRDGKGVEGHRAFVAQQLKVAEGVMQLEQALVREEEAGMSLHQLKLIAKGSDAVEWLVVLTVDTDNGPKVAFTSASSLVEALVSLGNRLRNRTLKWRDDEYRG